MWASTMSYRPSERRWPMSQNLEKEKLHYIPVIAVDETE